MKFYLNLSLLLLALPLYGQKSVIDKKAWAVEIDLEAKAVRIDFFSNHRKTITYKFRKYPTYISSPYTRVSFK